MSVEEQEGEARESVGRYVRERWAATEPTRSRRRSRRSPDPEPTSAVDDRGGPGTGTRTPPDGLAWGSELPDADEDLAEEIDPSTPPHGIDLTALRGARHRVPSDDPAPPDDPVLVEEPVSAAEPPTAPVAPVVERADHVERVEPEADPDGLPPAPPSRAARPRWTAPDAVDAREAQRRRSESDAGLGPGAVPFPTRRPPRSGWRLVVFRLTRGRVNPGESPADARQRELTARVNKPLPVSHKIAMLSLKGGVGKTTITATLGSTFASLREDRVVAVDANPDRGTLSQKIPLETTATVRHLLRDAQRVRRYSEVRSYTSKGASKLEVLAGEQDPAVSEAFSEEDYRRAVDLLEHFYNLVLTDCGTGLMHSAMYGVLGLADQLVIVSSGSIDGARSASATLDWLDAHGNGDLVRNAVVVVNTVHRRAGTGVDLDRVAEHFAGRCRAVVRVPFDGHLEEGAEIDLDRLEPATRLALLELAAAVADGFPS